MNTAEATVVGRINDLGPAQGMQVIPPLQPMQVQSRAITPITLLEMAVQNGADLDRLERLMALKQRYEEDEARKAFFEATSAMRATPITILKRKHVKYEPRNGGSGADYWHAELPDVTAAVDPVLAANGLSYRWDVKQDKGRVYVTCILQHRLGHTESITMDGPPDDSGRKNPLQQIQSTVTYLQRHTLLSITGSSTVGMDNDGRGMDQEPRGSTKKAVDLDEDEESRLVDQGNAEAEKGMAALTKWWQALSGDQRTALTPFFGSMKKVAGAKR